MLPYVLIAAFCALACIVLLVIGLCQAAATDEQWEPEECEVIDRERRDRGLRRFEPRVRRLREREPEGCGR